MEVGVIKRAIFITIVLGVLSYSALYVSEVSVSQSWEAPEITIAEEWQIEPISGQVVVAILDTGVDGDHVDLAGKVHSEVNFSDSSTPDDLYGHGTHCAGIITSIAPNCSLLNVKVANDQGRCYCRSIAQGIEWAVDHNASVINVSLCVHEPCDELEAAVNYAWQHGVVIIAAACSLEKGRPITCYPALYEQCIAVTAVKDDGSPIPLMIYEDWIDFEAPGSGVYSTLPDDNYGFKTGASPAVAYFSGQVASIMAGD